MRHWAGLQVVFWWCLCLWPQGNTDPGVTHHMVGLEVKAVSLAPGQDVKDGVLVPALGSSN